MAIERLLSFFIFLFICFSSALSQVTIRDAVYLKNGSIIKGSVTEIDSTAHLKIKTADGSLFVFELSQIEKVEKDTLTLPRPEKQNREGDPVKILFSVFGGAVFPLGDFAKEENGWAATGYSAGIQIMSDKNIGYILCLSLVSNPCTLDRIAVPAPLEIVHAGGSSTNWNSIFLLLGLKIGIGPQPKPDFMIAPLFGLNVSTSPEVVFTGLIDSPASSYFPTVFTLRMESATGIAAAYGVMIQGTINHFILGCRYCISSPKYSIEAAVTPYETSMSSSGMVKQNISFLQIYAGYEF